MLVMIDKCIMEDEHEHNEASGLDVDIGFE